MRRRDRIYSPDYSSLPSTKSPRLHVCDNYKEIKTYNPWTLIKVSRKSGVWTHRQSGLLLLFSLLIKKRNDGLHPSNAADSEAVSTRGHHR